MPKIVPTRSNIKVAIMTMIKPTIPVVIFFLADSSACLSPPEPIILIAPVIKVNINQIMATIVMTPIAIEIIAERVEIPESLTLLRIPVPSP